MKEGIRKKGFSESGDPDEHLTNVHDDVPVLFQNLLRRKNTPADLADKARRSLGICERETPRCDGLVAALTGSSLSLYKL